MDGHLGRLEFVIVRRPHVALKRCEVMFRQTLKSCAFASRVERLGLVILPVGLFLDRVVESFLSDFPKNICCRLTKSDLALQLSFVRLSESMGNHDSNIVDAGSVD